MSQLHGKQLKNQSTSLNKLSGTGIVSFTASSIMNFNSGAKLTTVEANINDGIDVVNKAYVDSVVQGLDIKESVKVKIDSSVTISDSSTVVSVASSQTPSVGLTAGDRVLLNGQLGATPSVDNGIWLVGTGTASLTRPADFTGDDTVTPGAFTFVEEGTFADSGFVLITDGDITIGTIPIKFVQFSSAGVIQAGDGLVKTGNTLDVDLATDSGLTFSSSKLKVATSIGGDGLTLTSGVLNVGVDTTGLSVDGTQVSLNSTITGGRTFSNTVNFGDNIVVANGATVSGGLDVSDGATIDELNVTQGATIDGGLNATEGATVSGGLDVTEGATIDTLNVTDGATVSGGLDVSDGATIDELNVTQGATVSGGLDVTEGADISGGATVSGGLDVTDGLTSDTIDATTITGGTGSFTNLTVTEAPSDADDVVNLAYHGASFSQLEDLIGDITSDAITGVTAGSGLSGGGTAGFITLDVNVNADSLEITNDEIRLKDTITGGRTFSNTVNFSDNIVVADGVSITDGGLTVVNGGADITGDLSVTGDFTVAGTVSFINTQELEVTDNIVTLAKGNTGSLVGEAGIKVDRGLQDKARFIWKENIDLWTAGLSGSEAALALYAGEGLLKDANSATFSLDYDIFGTGLTVSGTTVTVDTSGVTGNLAGAGLTANGGKLDVRATNGLNVNTTSDSVELGGTLTKDTTIDGDGSSGLTFTNLDNFVVITTDFNITATQSIYTSGDNEGIKYADAGYVTDPRSLTDKEYVDGVISAATASTTYLDGDGLDLDGLTFSVNTGLGLTISGDDVAMVWGGTSSGLTFSNNAVKASVDGTTIVINNSGELEVVAGSAQPNYERFTGKTASAALSENIASLSINPSDYSRIEVYINGLKVVAEGNVAGLSSSVSGASVNIANLEIEWKGPYDIEETDVIEVVYEA